MGRIKSFGRISVSGVQGFPNPLLLSAELSNPEFKSKNSPHSLIRPEGGRTWLSKHFSLLYSRVTEQVELQTQGGSAPPRALSQHCAHRAQGSQAGARPSCRTPRGGLGWGGRRGVASAEAWGTVLRPGTPQGRASPAGCPGGTSRAHAPGAPASLQGWHSACCPGRGPRVHLAPNPPTDAKPDQRGRRRPPEDSATTLARTVTAPPPANPFFTTGGK